MNYDDYFMFMAKLVSCRSKDKNTKVGAVIVSEDNRVLSTGYNGFLEGFEDREDLWLCRDDHNFFNSKYAYVVHAEENAIHNLNVINRERKYKMYVTLQCCYKCAETIIQSKQIGEVIYLEDKYKDTESVKIGLDLFKRFGIKVRKLVPKTKETNLKLS